MIKLISLFVQNCVARNYISHEKAPWLQYNLERKISSFVISIPLLILGILLSTPSAALAFYTGFCFLRERTNGWHAKTVMGCFIFSILYECLFLGVLFWYLNTYAILAITILSSLIIFVHAPYNHPNMKLSKKDLERCALGAKTRLLIIAMFYLLLSFLGFHAAANGLSLGIAMTALLLVFAYINKNGGDKNECTRIQNQEPVENCHHCGS